MKSSSFWSSFLTHRGLSGGVGCVCVCVCVCVLQGYNSSAGAGAGDVRKWRDWQGPPPRGPEGPCPRTGVFPGRPWDAPEDTETGECHSRTAFQSRPRCLCPRMRSWALALTYPAATFLLCRTEETQGSSFCCCSRLCLAMDAKQTHLPCVQGPFKCVFTFYQSSACT